MVELSAYFDGKVIVPDEPLTLEPNQRLRIQVELIEPSASTQHARRFGLQRGAVAYMAPDFDAELDESFWSAIGQ